MDDKMSKEEVQRLLNLKDISCEADLRNKRLLIDVLEATVESQQQLIETYERRLDQLVPPDDEG